MRLKDKIAIVTGGGSGIGRETARLFGREGARVVVADYDPVAGGETVRIVRDAGGEALFVEVDVSRSSQVAHLVDTTVEAYGTVSVLFNNAGIVYFGTVLQTDEKTWEKVIAVNLTGTYLCSRAVLPHMIRNGGGSIINMTSSTGAHDAGGNSAAYVASKGGVALLTRAMAIDHAKEGVRVNAIAPGPTDTHMLSDNMEREALNAFVRSTIPMNRLGKPEEQACVALFLASDEASFVTGAIFAVDGGQTALV